ncbi:MAG: hypothetical protein ACP5I3_09050 [Thermoproteus sp.]
MKGASVELPPMEVLVDEDGSEVLLVLKDDYVQIDCENGVIRYKDTVIRLGIKCTYKEGRRAVYIYPL